MSPAQVLKQLRWILRNVAYADSPTEVIFGSSVYITAAVDPDRVAQRAPFALLNLGGAMVDEHDPGLFRQEITLVICAEVRGDDIGEQVFVGGPRASYGGSSKGRGLLEIEPEALAAVENLTGADGIPILVSDRSASDGGGGILSEDAQVVFRSYTLEVWCTRETEYLPPVDLKATNLGGGSVRLAWRNPPSTYGLRRVILRRAAGATPPASPTDGTLVYNGGLAVTYDDNPGAGQHSYALFAAYTETGESADQEWSSQEKGSYRTHTVV